jgi:hypothetical protein
MTYPNVSVTVACDNGLGKLAPGTNDIVFATAFEVTDAFTVPVAG